MLNLAAQNYSDAKWQEVLGHVPSAAEKKALAENREHIYLKATNALLLETLLAPIDEVAELLAKRTWTLVSFDEPWLFTGEHPLVHVTGAAGGYGAVTAEQFHFPISPTRTLLLSHPWATGRRSGCEALGSWQRS